MRILYIHQYFAVPSAGGATRSYEMARRLVQAGHEVTILSSSAFLPRDWAPTPGWHRKQVDGIAVEVLHLPYSNTLSFGQRIKRFTQFMAAATLRARRWSGHVVFATSTPLTVAVPGVLAARRNRVPMVFEVRDLWPEIPIAVGALRNPVAVAAARWLEGFAYRNAARIVALSPGMADGIRRRNVPPERIVVIPNGCDLRLFDVNASEREAFLDRHPYLRQGPVVTYTGTMGPINGVGYLIEIAREMRSLDPTVTFVIAGDGLERPKIRQQALDADLLERQVWMLPPMPKRDVARLLSVARVATSLFIDLPEMWSNSANKVFDAFAAGRPVMINYQGWQAKLLETSGAGIVVPSGEPRTAAQALRAFLDNPEALAAAGRRARTLAERHFNRDILAARLCKVLEDAAATTPGGAGGPGSPAQGPSAGNGDFPWETCA